MACLQVQKKTQVVNLLRGYQNGLFVIDYHACILQGFQNCLKVPF